MQRKKIVKKIREWINLQFSITIIIIIIIIIIILTLSHTYRKPECV